MLQLISPYFMSILLTPFLPWREKRENAKFFLVKQWW
jgi:hypothetical protein